MKIGIVGTNFVSDHFMAGIKEFKKFEVVAVCSKSKKNADSFAKKYNINHSYTDYKKMADSMCIDAAYVAVPNSLHHDVSVYFLSKKINVLCEKPFSSNLNETYNMLRVAKENEVIIMEAIIPIYTPNFDIVRNNLSKLGTIRRAVFCYGRYSSRYDLYKNKIPTKTFERKYSNGSVMDIGVYCLYNAITMFGKPLKVIANALLLETGVDGLGTAILKYPDKEVVIMHSKITNSVSSISIEGEDGTLTFEGISFPKNIKIQYRNGTTSNLGITPKHHGMYYEIKAFYDSIGRNKCIEVIEYNNLTVLVQEILDQIRSETGIVFPADLK